MLLAFATTVMGQELSFGQITITPYIATEAGLDATTNKLLWDKMAQVVTSNEASGGFDQRFIITPAVNVLSENETASIPQKTSMKVSITFYVGDGVSGALYNSCNIEVTGVGDNNNSALHSAIRKVNAKDDRLQQLIKDAKSRIVDYYNSVAPSLIKEAEGYMASYDYEDALARLSVIPSLCSYYAQAQPLISKCGSKIMERDNNALLAKAKAAWNANPNEEGANEAKGYLSQIIISSTYYKNEVDKLSRQMGQRLAQIEDRKMEIEKTKLLSSERLEVERINASSRVASSFVSSIPRLVYQIFRWF